MELHWKSPFLILLGLAMEQRGPLIITVSNSGAGFSTVRRDGAICEFLSSWSRVRNCVALVNVVLTSGFSFQSR